ncbi:MAG: amino acid permease [Candidatus Woesearchaeota archaeon]
MDQENQQPQLERTLSYPVILIITINSILGTGIFFLPAVGAKVSGPASLIAWIILSITSIYLAMIFAELTSMFPHAGGIYEFCKQAYGRGFSFLVGWIAILAGNITIAMLVIGAVTYLVPYSGTLTVFGLSMSTAVFNMFVAIFFVLVFNYIAYKGMDMSATMLVAFGIITLSSLLLLIVPGSFSFSLANLEPFFPEGVGAVALLLTVFLISETFFGIETATFLAGETKDGERVMPKALIVSMVLISIISFVFVLVSLSSMPLSSFVISTAPLSDLAGIFYGEVGKSIFAIIVYLAITGSVAGWIVSAPRLLLAMAQDKLFLSQVGKVHPKNKTPYNAILFQTFVIVGLIVFATFTSGAYMILLRMLLPLQLIMYVFVAYSLLVLRKTMPNKQRYYVTPFPKIGIALLTLFYGILIYLWVTHEPGALNLFMLILSLIGFGIPLYLLIEVYYDTKMVTSLNDFFAYLTNLTERFVLSYDIRQRILNLIGDVKNKTVVEYGCSVGTLTVDLAAAVGDYGVVYATDISKNHILLTQKKLLHHKNRSRSPVTIHTLHDERHYERIHPTIPYADVVVSVGSFGYIQNIDQILKDMAAILPDQGRICFVEFTDFFKILPNIEWLNDDQAILRRFKEAGFTVRIERRKGVLWNTLFIYGMKSKTEVPFV